MSPSRSNAIHVLIVDDHPVVCAGMTSMLSAYSDILVVGSAASGREALSLTQQYRPDIMLLDLRMVGMDGIAVLNALGAMEEKPRVIILTSFEKEEDIYRAVQAGAQGYLLKEAREDEVIAAIHSVYEGRRYLPQHIAARLADRMMRADLSGREMEILKLLSEGCTNKQIGACLRISESTVRHHLNNIMDKLQVSDRTEAVTTAYRLGLLKEI